MQRAVLDRVVAVINGKGGVLKTTIVANFAALLAGSGWRVLVVDLDPQGNLAEDLGYDEAGDNDNGHALAQAMIFGQKPVLRTNVRAGLDVLAGGEELNTVGPAIAARKNSDQRLALATALASIADDYDLIIIDCPPGEELLQTNALAAAHYAIVPVKSDKSSRKGMFAVQKRLESVLDVNPDIDLLGVVLTDVSAGSSAIRRDARDEVTKLFGHADVLFDTTIRHSEATAAAARKRGLVAHELEEKAKDGPAWWQIRRGEAVRAAMIPMTASVVAADMQALTQEVIDRLTKAQEREAQEA